MKKRRKYDREFKQMAVELTKHRNDLSVLAMSNEYGVAYQKAQVNNLLGKIWILFEKTKGLVEANKYVVVYFIYFHQK